jgi:hypothetical protein
LARDPADSENDKMGADTAPSLAEIEALKQRLAALEARLPESAAAEPRRRSTRKMTVCLVTGAGLAMLAGVSLVYGGDALSISPDGKIGIGTATPAATLDVIGGLLHVAGTTAPTFKSEGAYVGWNALTGGTGETDFINNQGGGPGGFAFMNTPPSGDPRATLMVISGAGDVGIGTVRPDDKLDVAGGARVAALNVAGKAGIKELAVAGSASITGLAVPGMKIDGKNALEFGAGVTKEGNAGQIAYQKHSGDALDIVGAGTTAPERKIKMWAEGGATLYGSLNVAGFVDGNMKVVYQRDDEPQTTYQKPLWRYHMSLTAAKYAGKTKTIPEAILTELCAKADGCEVRLGMTRWDNAIVTETASISNRLYIGDNGRWRVSWPRDTEGVIGNGKREDAMHAWSTCYLTDATFDNSRDQGDKQTGLQLLVWNGDRGQYNNPARTCELTIIP